MPADDFAGLSDPPGERRRREAGDRRRRRAGVLRELGRFALIGLAVATGATAGGLAIGDDAEAAATRFGLALAGAAGGGVCGLAVAAWMLARESFAASVLGRRHDETDMGAVFRWGGWGCGVMMGGVMGSDDAPPGKTGALMTCGVAAGALAAFVIWQSGRGVGGVGE